MTLSQFTLYQIAEISCSIFGYQVSYNRGLSSCILTIRMAFRHFNELPERFQLIVDGYSAYSLAVQQFFRGFDDTFKFYITQGISLTNDDKASTKFRPYKHNRCQILNKVEMSKGADNMPDKWQLLIFLGQKNILQMQKSQAEGI